MLHSRPAMRHGGLHWRPWQRGVVLQTGSWYAAAAIMLHAGCLSRCRSACLPVGPGWGEGPPLGGGVGCGGTPAPRGRLARSLRTTCAAAGGPVACPPGCCRSSSHAVGKIASLGAAVPPLPPGTWHWREGRVMVTGLMVIGFTTGQSVRTFRSRVPGGW